MAFVEFGIACPAALARDRFGFFLTSLLPRAYRVFETNLRIRAPFTKWEPGMPVALGDQLRRPRLK
jgi:hypothetical protein